MVSAQSSLTRLRPLRLGGHCVTSRWGEEMWHAEDAKTQRREEEKCTCGIGNKVSAGASDNSSKVLRVIFPIR